MGGKMMSANAFKKKKVSKLKKINIWNGIIIAILTVFAILAVYPLYNVLLISITSYKDSTVNGLYLIPKHIDFSSYIYIFKDATIPRGFLVTIIVTVLGTAFNMFLSVTMAYALSKKNYPGRNIFLYMVIITMIFTGELIPYYLVVNGLGLVDSILSMIIPTGINTFYLILLMNYFGNIPDSMEEAAKIDGANDITILFSIILPIAKPILATVILFYAVDRWNDYFNAMLFIRNPNLLPIQTILRNMLINMSTTISSSMGSAIVDSKTPVYTQGIRMSIVMVTSLPIFMLFPFLQPFFTKGIMLGSIKS
jgi:putative aldouronate transport system permease protein